MSLLVDGLPDTVEIGGVDYRINTGFRTAILFELMMQDVFFYPAEKQDMALKLFFPTIPSDFQSAMHAIIWFYSGGDRQPSGGRKSKRRGNNDKKIYSYEHDDQYIYSAFMEQYGIDLTDANLHWWQFRALFAGLNEKCKICQIMHYRGMEIAAKMSKEEQKFYREMKKLYALPISEDEQQKQDAIEAALMGDGDLTGLL